METHRYPFHIDSALDKFEVAEDLKVIKIDEKIREELFQIKDFKKIKNVLSITFHNNSDPVPKAGFLTSYFANENSSTHVLYAENQQRANVFNIALKLMGISSTTLYTGYGISTPSLRYVSLCSYDSSSVPLRVTKKDVPELVTLVKLIQKSHDNKDNRKFQIACDIFQKSMQPAIRPETRFLEFTIILEMLLLPGQNLELSYQFSLRLAKVMNKFYSDEIREVYENGKNIYGIRSAIVHSGEMKKSADIDKLSKITYEYIRKLLILYLKDKTHFEKEYLENLCLG